MTTGSDVVSLEVLGPAASASTAGYEAETVYIYDDDFDGERKRITLLCYMDNSTASPDEIEDYEWQEIILKCFTFTKELARYQEKSEQQMEALDIEAIGLFPSEPIVVPSNIEGGYGIFGIRVDSVYRFRP